MITVPAGVVTQQRLNDVDPASLLDESAAILLDESGGSLLEE